MPLIKAFGGFEDHTTAQGVPDKMDPLEIRHSANEICESRPCFLCGVHRHGIDEEIKVVDAPGPISITGPVHVAEEGLDPIAAQVAKQLSLPKPEALIGFRGFLRVIIEAMNQD